MKSEFLKKLEDSDLKKFDLPHRIMTSLERAEIYTLYDLLQAFKDGSIKYIPHIGKVSIQTMMDMIPYIVTAQQIEQHNVINTKNKLLTTNELFNSVNVLNSSLKAAHELKVDVSINVTKHKSGKIVVSID